MRRSVQGFPTITVDPAVGGKPCIRGMRVTVGMILDEIGAGTTADELLASYPYLTRGDILEAQRFGAASKRAEPTRETAMPDFHRITRKAGTMQGKACIRGMRITVGMILGNLAAGETIEDLLRLYPELERDDILEAIRYGAWLASEREIELDPAA